MELKFKSTFLIFFIMVFTILGGGLVFADVVATPTASPAGGYYNSTQSVELSTTTTDAVIRYTTNGVDPTNESTVYSTPISISSTATLKAKAWATGSDPSAIMTEEYTIDNTAPTYTISYSDSGPVKSGDSVTITAEFSEAMLIGNIPQIALSGAATGFTATNMSRTDADTYTYAWTVGTGDGVMTPTVTVGTDLAGNAIDQDGSTKTTITVDNTAPTIPVANIVGTTVQAGNDTILITFDEPVVAVDGTWSANEFTSIVGSETLAITLTNATFNYSGSALTITLDYEDDDMFLTNGEYITVTPALNTIKDAAGNSLSDSAVVGTTTVTGDVSAPTVALTYSADQTHYKSGDTVTITATFNEIVYGDGTADVPQISIAVPGTGTVTTADMTIVGVDETQWAYNWTVGDGDGTATVTIIAEDLAGNSNATATNNTKVVDNTAPTIPVENIVGTTIQPGNDTILITFDEPVVAADGTWSFNEFASIAGSDTGAITLTNATFNYSGSALTITLDYEDDDMFLTNGETITVTPAADAIKDAAGNSVVITPVVGTTAVTGDVTSATVSNVTSTIEDGSYTVDENINITIEFSEIVVVTGAPQLTLETGDTDRIANYASGSGTTTLTFTYTVQTGDTSSDLDYVATGSLALNGGTINDLAGNDATLTLAAPGAANSLGANKAIIIDTTAPTAPSAVHIASDNSTTTLAKVGNTITITATVDAGTTVTGTIGGKATTTNGVVGTTATLTRVLDGNETEGAGLDFTLVSTDAAGNNATTVTKADIIDGSAVKTDFTAPTVTLENGHADLIVKDADADVVITATFNENMISAPTITIDGPGACDVTSAMTEDTNPAWTYAWNVPAACDGAATVTVAGFDLAGNAYIGSTNLVYTIDNTAPTVSSITPVNLNQSNVGTVTVDITFNEPMTETDTVTVSTAVINGTPSVTYSSWVDSNTWRGTFTLADNNEEVNTAYYTVSGATDVAGNSLVAIVERGVNNILNVDTVTPTLTTVSIASNNTNDTSLAKVGDVITLTIVSSEAIASPTVTIDGETASVSGSSTNWSATLTLDSDNNSGVIPFTIDFTDAAGNPGTQVTAVTTGSNVTFDKTGPAVNVGADMFTATDITRTATATDTGGSGIVTTVWSKLSGSGTITFGTSTALTTTISASDSGEYVIRLTATDNAGNVTTDDFKLTVGSYAFSYPSNGDLFDSVYSDAYFRKDMFTGMNIYDEDLTMELFLNSAAGIETQRLIADDVAIVYVHTDENGWTTLDKESFSKFDLYSVIADLSNKMDKIYMYFDFVTNAANQKAIRHIPAAD